MRLLRPLGELLPVGCAVLLAAVSLSAQTAPTAATPAAKPTSGTAGSKTSSTTTHKKTAASKHRKRKTTASWRKHGQQKIDPQRASEIQQALIREHYLTGTASGVWDDASEKAMKRYQSDNGWQDKSTPDARALIKLGLGPDTQHLLNPESAMTSSVPDPPAATTPGPGADQKK